MAVICCKNRDYRGRNSPGMKFGSAQLQKTRRPKVSSFFHTPAAISAANRAHSQGIRRSPMLAGLLSDFHRIKKEER